MPVELVDEHPHEFRQVAPAVDLRLAFCVGVRYEYRYRVNQHRTAAELGLGEACWLAATVQRREELI